MNFLLLYLKDISKVELLSFIRGINNVSNDIRVTTQIIIEGFKKYSNNVKKIPQLKITINLLFFNSDFFFNSSTKVCEQKLFSFLFDSKRKIILSLKFRGQDLQV